MKWLREPLTYTPALEASTETIVEKLNNLFRSAFDAEVIPTLSDVAGVAGYDSVVQMLNDARRKGAERMRPISRVLTAIQAYYEREALMGNSVAMKILERLPQFDHLEPMQQPESRAFAPNVKEVLVHVSGMERTEDRGKELTPAEAYAELIAERSFERISEAVTLEADKDGVFGLPTDAIED